MSKIAETNQSIVFVTIIISRFKRKKTVIANQFKIVRTTITRGFSQMHLATILIGHFNLSVFTVCISIDKPKIVSR